MAGHTTLAHDSGATGDTVAAGHPAGENYLLYLDILRKLGDLGAAVNSALVEAHTAATAHQRRAALTTLHTRLRSMAATANDALGNWPESHEAPL